MKKFEERLNVYSSIASGLISLAISIIALPFIQSEFCDWWQYLAFVVGLIILFSLLMCFIVFVSNAIGKLLKLNSIYYDYKEFWSTLNTDAEALYFTVKEINEYIKGLTVRKEDDPTYKLLQGKAYSLYLKLDSAVNLFSNFKNPNIKEYKKLTTLSEDEKFIIAVEAYLLEVQSNLQFSNK